MPSVEQDVRQGITDLARRSQQVKVIAIAEDGSASREDPIHGTRESRRDGLHPTGEI